MISIYVDGSYSSTHGRAGWGWVAVLDDLIIAEDYGSVSDDTGSRNVLGELMAAAEAILWAVENELEEVTIVHDYMGIGHWARGIWRAKSQLARDYMEVVIPAMNIVKLRFVKVRGHSGNKYNDYADRLASRYLNDVRRKE